jgi:hypothetical protein
MGHMKALLVAAATALAVGCGAGPQSPARRDATTPAAFKITRIQACHRLRDALARNRGAAAIPTLRVIADHVTEPRMAADARTAVRDIDHTGVAPLALGLLRDDCARAGVPIPAG